MKAVFVSESEGHVTLSLDISTKELAAYAEGCTEVAEALKFAVLEAFREVNTNDPALPEQDTPAPQKAQKPFKAIGYKGIRIQRIEIGHNEQSPEDLMKEMLLDEIIACNDIDIPEEQIENETRFEMVSRAQTLKYQAFMNRDLSLYHKFGSEADRAEVEREVIRQLKVEKILQSVIDQEQITVTREELRERAAEIAARQQITMDMIERFYGKDFELLESDAMKDKALHLIYESAVMIGDENMGNGNLNLV